MVLSSPARMAEVAALLVVVGPTASGKTELASSLAERLHGEVVSADSIQIYRRFDLGSGKPTTADRERVPHHCIDAVEPNDPMDAARFLTLADHAIAEISGRGLRPIVCGGTFLWVRALLFGLAPAPPADPAVRARHAERAAREGRPALHRVLAEVDPVTAARLAPNDLVRVSRALEVYELSGVPLSAWQAEHGFQSPRYPARLLGIRRSTEELDARIATRLDAMFAAGWVREVRELLRDGYAESRPMRSVGYRQIAEELLGTEGSSDVDLRTRIYRATRVFARRQRTWLRDQPVRWLAAEEATRPTTDLIAELAAPIPP